MVVVEEGGSRIGLVVEELLDKQEVVVKSLGDSFAAVRGVAGGAILGDGRIGLILDPTALSRWCAKEAGAPPSGAADGGL